MGERLTDEQVQAWREAATEDMQVMLGLRSDLGPWEVLRLCDERDQLRGEVDALREHELASLKLLGSLWNHICELGFPFDTWWRDMQPAVESAVLNLAAVPADAPRKGGE